MVLDGYDWRDARALTERSHRIPSPVEDVDEDDGVRGFVRNGCVPSKWITGITASDLAKTSQP